VVLRATGTYLCNGVCIANNECCERGTAGTPTAGCPDELDDCEASTGNTSPATCKCDPSTSCCATVDGNGGTIDCPTAMDYPDGYVCSVIAVPAPGDTDGACAACAAGETVDVWGLGRACVGGTVVWLPAYR
jgi:hypothetical protein